jgi:outer membrane protein TolC
MPDLKGSNLRWLLSSLLLAAFLGAAAEAAILSEEKQLQLRLKAQKNQEEAVKLQNSWINPLTLSATQTTNNTGTDYESESMTYRLTLSQDLFRSGGIYFAIQYADAVEKLQQSLLRLEEQQQVAQAQSLLLQLKRTRLLIQKQKLAIHNAEIDVKYKQEQYKNGLTDIGFLSNAILTKNQLKSARNDLESAKADLVAQFANLSDLEPEAVDAIELNPLDKEAYLNRNLAIAGKEHEIESKRYVKNMTLTNYLPKITVDASYVREDSQTNLGFASQEKDEAYYNYGVKLSIPLNISTFNDIESARLDYLVSRSELATQKREEANFYESTRTKIEAIRKKIALAREDYALYDKLLLQVREQQQAGYKTDDDVTVMENSKNASRLDIDIYDLDIRLERLKLYAKMMP